MKYTEQEQLQQILLRGEQLRRRKDLRAFKGLSASAAALLCALAVCIGSLGRTGFAESRTVYGSFLLSAETGGYVLVAVLAFVLGVVIAILLTKRTKWGTDTRAIRAEHRSTDEHNKNGGNEI